VCIHPLAYWLGLKILKVYPAVGEALDLDIGLHAVKKVIDKPSPAGMSLT
jgi:hypothetical protein